MDLIDDLKSLDGVRLHCFRFGTDFDPTGERSVLPVEIAFSVAFRRGHWFGSEAAGCGTGPVPGAKYLTKLPLEIVSTVQVFFFH